MGDPSTVVPVQPSNDLTYANQRSFGVIAGRSTVEISPKYGGIFKAGDIIRLEIPSQAWLDPKDFFISFRTSIKAGAGNNAGAGIAAGDINVKNVLPYMTLQSTMYQGTPTETLGEMSVRFLPGIQCIFSRARLMAGSVVIEDIQDYNVLYRLFMENSTTREWRATDGFTQEGWYDPESPSQMIDSHNWHAKKAGNNLFQNTNSGHTHTIRPLFGLFLANKMLPLKYMGQLTIELYLEQNEECLWSTSSYMEANHHKAYKGLAAAVTPINPARPNAWTNSTLLNYGDTINTAAITIDYPNASYEVDQVNMHIPFVHPIDSFDSQMMHAIENGKLDIHFSTWQTHTRQLPSISTRVTLSFQERAVSLKGGLACFRNSPDIRAIDNDMNFPANGIASYQWKVGSEYIPSQDIKCLEGAGRALSHLKQSLGQYSDIGATSTITEYNYLPIDLPSQLDTTHASELKRGCSEPSKFVMGLSLEKSRGQTSGFDSSASSVDVELILQLRNHHDIVGRVPGGDDTPKHCGALQTATFQPSKKRCISRELLVRAAAEQTAAYVNSPHKSTLIEGSNSFITSLENGVTLLLNTDETRRYGHMTTKTLTVTGADKRAGNDNAMAGLLTTNNIRFAQNENSTYARVYFFAHLDAVLKLSAVGRMEIVR